MAENGKRMIAMNRRQFLVGTGAGLAAGMLAGQLRGMPVSRLNKLNVAVVGTSGQAGYSIEQLKNNPNVNLVAFADVDKRNLEKIGGRFSKATLFTDYRKMLDEKGYDCCVVATPDHHHAPAAAKALRAGLHVYCEKPLTHTVYEARTLINLAAEKKRVTQMGTQIHAENNYRRVVELIEKGAIGPVREVHVVCGKGWSDGRKRAAKPAPATLDWDLWCGPAPKWEYQDDLHPMNWRKYWDFGGGTLADMACHYMDLPFWALKLRHPTTIDAEGPPVHEVGTPASLKVTYEYPERDGLAACKLTWYDGDRRPDKYKDLDAKYRWGNGVLFVGDKGMLLADYGRLHLLPEADFKDYKRPDPYIASSIGHHNEWIKACMEGGKSLCDFSYSGVLTEAVLLGNVAYRTGKKLQWDAANLKATNCPEADAFLRREYRKGWEL